MNVLLTVIHVTASKATLVTIKHNPDIFFPNTDLITYFKADLHHRFFLLCL